MKKPAQTTVYFKFKVTLEKSVTQCSSILNKNGIVQCKIGTDNISNKIVVR